jgi:hypothetical protein
VNRCFGSAFALLVTPGELPQSAFVLFSFLILVTHRLLIFPPNARIITGLALLFFGPIQQMIERELDLI